MGESFLEFMKGIGIFIICAQSFLHFAAGKSYEKYVKLLIGVMILAQFVVPVRNLFLGTENGELHEEVERFQMELEYAMQNAQLEVQKQGLEIAATDAKKPITEEIRQRLSEAAKDNGYYIKEVQITEEPPKTILIVENLEMAQAKRQVEQRQEQQSQGSEEKQTIQIDKIPTIDAITIGQNMESKENAIQDERQLQELQEIFANLLGTKIEYVEVVEG